MVDFFVTVILKQCINYFHRFGLGDFSWSEFIPRLKPKTPEEIKEYILNLIFLSALVLVCLRPFDRMVIFCFGLFVSVALADQIVVGSYGTLFLSHIAEDINDAPCFSGMMHCCNSSISLQTAPSRSSV